MCIFLSTSYIPYSYVILCQVGFNTSPSRKLLSSKDSTPVPIPGSVPFPSEGLLSLSPFNKGGGPKFLPLSFTITDPGHSETVPFSPLTEMKDESRRVTDDNIPVRGRSPGPVTSGLSQRTRISSVSYLDLLPVVSPNKLTFTHKVT